MKNILIFLAVLTGFWAPAAFADCSNTTIAEMKWASAGIAAHVDKIILEKGYNCTVSLVPGDILPTFGAMITTGQPDIASEFWINSLRIPLNAAIRDGQIVTAAEILSDGAVEGWWIPKYIADAHPDIKTVQDALKHPELFRAPGETASLIHDCPPDWKCKVSTTNLFRALDAENKGFQLSNTSSAEELNKSIMKAFESKMGWLGYYWAPTAILGKYEMKRLSFEASHDKEAWDECIAVPGCTNPSVNSYPVSQAFTLVTTSFANRAGPAMDYLERRSWDNATINDVLAWQDTHHASNEDSALYFMKTFPDIWKNWVPSDIAQKISALITQAP